MPDRPPLAARPVVLASASRTRLDLLRAAALDVSAEPSDIDEAAVVAALGDGGESLPPADIAALLAEAKARDVAARRPGELVIGADQTLDLNGELFVKPASAEEARRNLLRLSGRTHALHAAAVLVADDETVWSVTSTAWMTVRPLTPEFVGRYQGREGDAILSSVGAYRVEGAGIQLFEAIDGDWFTILGLPLLPLLGELRRRGVLER